MTIGYRRHPAARAGAGGLAGQVGSAVVGVNVVEGREVVSAEEAEREGCPSGKQIEDQPK
jgi:hypothetical protein